jgi:single-strand DNA-binding protein
MSSVNKVIIVGNVGKDPEIRHLDGGVTVASFTMATSEKWKDKNGNQQESTEWHNMVVWGKLAEIVEKYIKKGSKLYVEGKIQTRSWEKEGVKKYVTEIKVNELTMLDSKGGNNNQSQPAAAQPTYSGGMGSQEEPDDLPF